MIGFIGQTIAQNLRNDNKENLKNIYEYINDNSLAICSENYKFIGVYQSKHNEQLLCSVFLGDYDVINEMKIIDSKIYYIAGLIKCGDEEFNDTSTTVTKFYIDIGNSMKVRYYNFSGNVSYMNRNLIYFQTTDILNPPDMNAMYKTIDVVYENIYFPEAYGLDYNYELNFTELAKESIETLYKHFHKIEDEYKKL
jgi:hypothetical protein